MPVPVGEEEPAHDDELSVTKPPGPVDCSDPAAAAAELIVTGLADQDLQVVDLGVETLDRQAASCGSEDDPLEQLKHLLLVLAESGITTAVSVPPALIALAWSEDGSRPGEWCKRGSP